jgi:hypothetical protein
MKKGVLKNGRAMVWGFIDGVAANGLQLGVVGDLYVLTFSLAQM